MQKDTECIYTDPASYGVVTRAINISGSDDHVRNPEPFSVLSDNFVLFDFREAVRFPSELRARLNGATLVQDPPPRFLSIGIHGERADIDKPLEAFVMQACFEKIPCRHN